MIQALIDSIYEFNVGGALGSVDPLYYGVLALVLAFSLFIERKVFFMLYLSFSVLLFGVNGVAVALVFWVLFALPQLFFDFFLRRF